MTLSELLTIASALKFALSRGWPEGREDDFEKAIEVQNLIAQMIAAEDRGDNPNTAMRCL